MRGARKQDDLTRLLAKITTAETPDGCWLWRGYVDAAGYGQSTFGGVRMPAHQAVFRAYGGALSVGLEIDHVCRNRTCVNPLHLEAVTREENLRRSPIQVSTIHANKTHCDHGHPFDVINTRVRMQRGRPTRQCIECSRARSRATYARNRRSA